VPKPNKLDSYEELQEALDPHRREELERAMRETKDRLRNRGVAVTGEESSEELVTLLEGVERFERAVELRGGDLFVDEGPGGITREPDDVHFVLPQRRPEESVACYVMRLTDAICVVLTHPPINR
jgi:ABC-type sulfate/molybdate transport systems ATPase subunit